jgi:hypothetical protein
LRLLLPLALALGPLPARAQPTEEAVKAAFLTKFANYVGWPAGAQPAPGAPFMLCILGPDPFGRTIDQAAGGQQVDRHPIAVRRIAGADSAGGCHIVFVRGASVQILTALAGRHVLTVTDQRGGQARGMVHFVIDQGRVRFHIDEAAAARGGLSINSRLLALALTVRQRS